MSLGIPPVLQEKRKQEYLDPLVGRHILISCGPMKGHRGFIKHVNRLREFAQVELEAEQRLKNFKLIELSDLQ
jgi:transcription elongation factor